MSESGERVQFTMEEPRECGPIGRRFAFRFGSSELYLYDFVQSLPCIADIQWAEGDDWALVYIDDEFDPDEAWHWVRTDLEDETNAGLDRIWREAIWLL
jgi:hypothetical protein